MSKHNKEIVGGLTAAVAAVAGAQVAHAADAMSAPASDWSSAYIGISLGLEGGATPISFDGDYQLAAGPNFGAFLGVNHQMNDVVIGAELAIQSGVGGDKNNVGNGTYDVNYTADSKIKLGLAASDNLLIYGFGGISAGSNNNYSSRTYGWVAANFGVGAEVKVSEQFSVGAEVIARAPISNYGWSGHGDAGLQYQGSLRAALHF